MKLIDFTQVETIFIVCGKTDMRRQIDGLAATITEEYDMDVYHEALFLFCGGRWIGYTQLDRKDKVCILNTTYTGGIYHVYSSSTSNLYRRI